MEKKLILRGVLAGAIAGLLAFAFARIFAEPVINQAINYESGRDAVIAALDKAAGLPAPDEGPDIYDRTFYRLNDATDLHSTVLAGMRTRFATPFFVRLGRRMVLTAAGRRVLENPEIGALYLGGAVTAG